MTAILFILTAVLALLFFYGATGRQQRSLALFAGWGAIVMALAANGIFQRHPPLFAAVFAGTTACTIIAFRLLREKPLAVGWLLALHALRIVVEFGLYQLYLGGKVPEEMTFTGWNYDIVSGITALLLLGGMLVRGKKIGNTVFAIWNVAGLVLLLIIVALAILSAPLPVQQLAFGQPNVALLEAPYCLLPTVIVPLVCLAHLLALVNRRAVARP